jgi:glycosyltransferase involved in cell wall biosynthesis
MRPDVIHLHSSKAGAIGRIAARLAGVPAVYSPHGVSYLRTDVGVSIRTIFFALEWLLGPLGAMTVACSPSELRSIRFIPGRKTIIPNGIDLTSLPALDAAPPHDKLEVVLCGRITAQKNPDLACHIAALSPPQWRWTWLGDGELQDVVTRAGRIIVAGWQPRAAALARLCASDIMVHTSSWEGMPIAILEGMALGLPIVATNVIGNRDLIVNGKTGFVVDSASDFLAALKTLSESKELRHRMGAAGRARVADEFDQAQLAQRWMVLYKKCAA